MSVTDICSRLASLADSNCIVSDTARLASYQIAGVAPNAALRPTSIEQIVEIVKFAAAEKLAIIPIGAGTKFGMIPRPQRYDVALDMTALDRIAAYDPADLTLSVEPGVPLQRLAGVLAGHRQFLPLQVPFLNRATVGGAIASGIDSPLRQLYGTARDFVLGMEFVTGEGRVAKSGGRVVKNVSGFDLHKLMIGSFGTLGIITRINFRTFPMPATTHAFVAFFETVKGAAAMRQGVAQSALRPLSLEILNPAAVRLLSNDSAARVATGKAPAELSAARNWAVVVSFSGIPKVIARYERELAEIAHTKDLILLDEDATPALLARVREFVSIAIEASPRTVILKASVLPNRIAEFLHDAISIADEAEFPLAALARGVGVAYLALQPDKQKGATLRQTIERLFQACEKCRGHAEILWRAPGLPEMPAKLNSASNWALMNSLKKVFDPKNILAPDTFSRWMPNVQ
jgi:glycolate oxidase FAD binding subunit